MSKIVMALSLSGGQGKTTTIYSLALMANARGIPTLAIDGDPQRNLTDLLRVEVEEDSPTLLEVLKGEVRLEDAIYPVPGRKCLFLIPSDRALSTANQYLASLPNPAVVLKKRLQSVLDDFDLILVDSPPQKSHIVLTAIGAADAVIIPAETTAKGVGSLTESWSLLDECQDMEAFKGQIAGVLPFRARMFGNSFAKDTRANLQVMGSIVGETLVPPLVESERYKTAMNYSQTPSEMDESQKDIEKSFAILLEKLGFNK